MIKSSMTLFLTSFPPFGSETLCVEQIYKQNGKQCAGVIAKQWYGNRRTLLASPLFQQEGFWPHNGYFYFSGCEGKYLTI